MNVPESRTVLDAAVRDNVNAPEISSWSVGPDGLPMVQWANNSTYGNVLRST